MRFATTKKIFALSAALSGLAFACPRVGWAGEGEQQEARARALMAEGLEAEQAEDLVKARQAYRQSFKIYPSFDVAGNLGLVEVQLRQYVNAATHLRYCLKHFPTGENRELKRLVSDNYEKARQYVGAVKFTVSNPEAEILVDSKPIEFVPDEEEVFVLAGHHFASAKTETGSVEVEFAVEKGGSTEVELTLVEEPSSASAEDEPAFVAEPPPAVRTKRNWVPAYILGGVTLAAGGTSVVTRVIAGKKEKDAEALDSSNDEACWNSSSSDCSDLDSLARQHDTFGTVSNATLIGAGVAALGTIGYVTYVLVKKDEQPAVQASIGWGKRGATLLLKGHF
jgi:hypothetical protein